MKKMRMSVNRYEMSVNQYEIEVSVYSNYQIHINSSLLKIKIMLFGCLFRIMCEYGLEALFNVKVF